VLRFGSKRSNGDGRKVPQVHRNDGIRVEANSSGEHVPIVRIGEMQTGIQILVARLELVESVFVD
jgi:hypothetical protein